MEHIGNIDQYAQRLIFWQSCYSGALLAGNDRLDNFKSMVATSSDWDEPAYLVREPLYEGAPVGQSIIVQANSEFNLYSTGFLYGNAPASDYNTATDTRYFDGDDNNDGFITMDELSSYVEDSIRWSASQFSGGEGIWNDLVIGGRLNVFLHNRNIDYTRVFEGYNSVRAAGGGTYCTLEDNANVTMKAGDYVVLLDGFHAKEGCFLDAGIAQIGTYSSTALSEPITKQKDKESSAPEEPKEEIPTVFSCSQNYPNPFNRSTTIKYGLPVDSDVSLCIYNLLGQTVKTVNMKQSAGYKSFVWDRTNNAGNIVGSGMYFYILKAGDNKANKKMLVLK